MTPDGLLPESWRADLDRVIGATAAEIAAAPSKEKVLDILAGMADFAFKHDPEATTSARAVLVTYLVVGSVEQARARLAMGGAPAGRG